MAAIIRSIGNSMEVCAEDTIASSRSIEGKNRGRSKGNDIVFPTLRNAFILLRFESTSFLGELLNTPNILYGLFVNKLVIVFTNIEFGK